MSFLVTDISELSPAEHGLKRILIKKYFFKIFLKILRIDFNLVETRALKRAVNYHFCNSDYRGRPP